MSWRNIRFRKALPAAALLLLAFGASSETATAHEIPPNVALQAYLRPDGETLRVLLRVPLSSMRDMDLPLRGPGYLVVSEADQQLRDAAQLWLGEYMSIYENDELLRDYQVSAARVSIPSDQSFVSYEQALANTLSAPISDDTNLVWDQALLDVLLEYQISSESSNFAIRSGLAHLGIRTNSTLRFITPDGAQRVYQYVGDPGLVRLDPRWWQAAFSFVTLGFEHILGGLDHLLFVFCLVIPFRRLRPLIAVVTSFTVAHSITLISAAFGLVPNALWFPPLIETLIALSIVYMAFENIVGANLRRRWLVAFGFGLIHGFGFSFLLTESLQFAGSHLITSLLAFNVGVEFGQIFVLILTIPLLNLLFRKGVAERVGTIILSALVAHTAWHWMLDRGSSLLEYDFVMPVANASLMVTAMRWGMLALVILGVGWLLSELFGRLVRPAADGGQRA
jgi:hypothetical protein